MQQQLGAGKIIKGNRTYTREEVTDELDIFFRELNRAFWNHRFFRDQVSQADVTSLLRQILAVLPPRPDLEALRRDYVDYLKRSYEYLDLGGIAPKVANRTVKLRMQDIYVPVQAEREMDVRQLLQTMVDNFQLRPERSEDIMGTLVAALAFSDRIEWQEALAKSRREEMSKQPCAPCGIGWFMSVYPK